MKRKINTERMLARLARDMGLGYLNETWSRANIRLDKFRRAGGRVEDTGAEREKLPCLLNLQTIEGSIITDNGYARDEPYLRLCFCDAMPLDFTGAQARAVAEGLWRTAAEFAGRMASCGFWEEVPDTLPYRVTFDRLDANLCILVVEFRVREALGECMED